MEFIPTYLYIKQHTVTGKLYFGKTTSKDPIKYLGSGKTWVRNYKKHGKEHIITLWFQLYDNIFDLVSDAFSMSNSFNIVKSSLWMNLKPENGLDGYWFNEKGKNKGRKQSEKQIQDRVLKNTGKKRSNKQKENIANSQRGLKRSESHLESLRIARRKRPKLLNKKGKSIYILGFIFPSISFASRILNIGRGKIRNDLKTNKDYLLISNT